MLYRNIKRTGIDWRKTIPRSIPSHNTEENAAERYTKKGFKFVYINLHQLILPRYYVTK
jgi:hypothetical protein